MHTSYRFILVSLTLTLASCVGGAGGKHHQPFAITATSTGGPVRPSSGAYFLQGDGGDGSPALIHAGLRTHCLGSHSAKVQASLRPMMGFL